MRWYRCWLSIAQGCARSASLHPEAANQSEGAQHAKSSTLEQSLWSYIWSFDLKLANRKVLSPQDRQYMIRMYMSGRGPRR